MNNKIQMPGNGNEEYDDYDYEGDGDENGDNPYGQNPMYRQESPRSRYPGSYDRPFYGIISRKPEANQRNSSIPFV